MSQPRDIPAPMSSQWALFPTRLYGMMGCNANSGAVGHPLKTSVEFRSGRPCGHSPGSTWTSHEPTMIQHAMLPANSPNTQLALRTCCGQSELRARAIALGTSATRPPKMPRKLELHRAADRKPRHPMHNGNEANCHATSCCSALPNSSPRRNNIARCMPASWACAYVRERGGSMVRNLW